MNLAFYDLPKPSTIQKYTVSVQKSAPALSKYALKNLESGLTMNGVPRKVRFARRGKNRVV